MLRLIASHTQLKPVCINIETLIRLGLFGIGRTALIVLLHLTLGIYVFSLKHDFFVENYVYLEN